MTIFFMTGSMMTVSLIFCVDSIAVEANWLITLYDNSIFPKNGYKMESNEIKNPAKNIIKRLVQNILDILLNYNSYIFIIYIPKKHKRNNK